MLFAILVNFVDITNYIYVFFVINKPEAVVALGEIEKGGTIAHSPKNHS